MKKVNIFSKITYVTPASPVVLVSSYDNNNNDNVAPFSMFMVASTKPDSILAISISPSSDTYKNIILTKEYVIGIPSDNILKKIMLTSHKLESHVDEFEYSGLTKYPSNNLKCHKILECPVNIELKLLNDIDLGNHHLLLGKVISCDIDENVYSNDNLLLRKNISKVYHLTSNKFLINNKIEEIDEEDNNI